MGDATPTAGDRARESEAATYPISVHGRLGALMAVNWVEAPAPDSDDEDLARMLVLMWSLVSGRRLRSGVRPDQLGKEELISFWADDLVVPVTGRHARVSAHEGTGS